MFLVNSSSYKLAKFRTSFISPLQFHHSTHLNAIDISYHAVTSALNSTSQFSTNSLSISKSCFKLFCPLLFYQHIMAKNTKSKTVPRNSPVNGKTTFRIDKDGELVNTRSLETTLSVDNLQSLLSNLSLEPRTGNAKKTLNALASVDSTSSSEAGVKLRYLDNYGRYTVINTTPIQEEFLRYAKAQGWEPNSKQYKNELAKCCIQEFEYFSGGKGNTLQAWQQNCIDLECKALPPSINKCKIYLRRRYVNIYDYIDGKRAGKPIKMFTNFHKFCHYTLDGRVFPKHAAKENQLLKLLLEQVIKHK